MFKYILKNYVLVFFATLFALTAIVLLFDVIELDDNLLPSEETLLELLQSDGGYQMTLSLVSPDEDELECDFSNSYYNLIKREGFVYSVDYADSLVKRKNLVMFKEGSCFDFDIKGTIQDVSDNGKHPVYRGDPPV